MAADPAGLRAPAIPAHVEMILGRLWSAGHAAYVVGGALRDGLLGREAPDWDVATDAPADVVQERFPGSASDNRFGTVRVPADRSDRRPVEITTFRRDHRYRDHRRPDRVTFTGDVTQDLARRDFTVNALAWGRPGDRPGAAPAQPGWLDPTGGLRDLEARSIRAVGDPAARFDEDALRLLRAVRFAAQLDFTIEPATRAAIEASAALVGHLSAERVRDELLKLLGAERPSIGLRLLDETGLLDHLLPELAAQRGVPQDKAPGMDLWAHTLATVDAAARLVPGDTTLALAAFLHDVGKPATLAEGHFIGHEDVGAALTGEILGRLRVPNAVVERVTRLVALHMYRYEPAWSDAAVRRFMRKVGPDHLDDLFRLRRADSIGSGRPAESGDQDELERRVRQELEVGSPLSLSDLAVDGEDLMATLGLPPGPQVGALLSRLLDSVVADPARNERRRLLADAREWHRRGAGGAVGAVMPGEELT
ncbi:MAG TPA: HD domain-containing protein [Candidatus Limnocylindrales bacterium]|nr:HD domain-containing protein [Candidatus Limnocylindrales bacterium]